MEVSNLNINDAIRSLANGLKDSKLKSQFKDMIATIIVMGEESCGKTTTLMRLCDLELPTARKTCTRVAHVIQLRKSESQKVTISLLDHTNGKTTVKGSFDGPDYPKKDICAKIKEVQDELNLGEGFSEDYEIQIEKLGHPRNLTLVDLPGLVDVSDTSDTHQTYKIYQKYTQMQATIIFHIVAADRNINTTQGNKFISGSTKTKDCVTVFTKLDKLVNPESIGYFKDALGSLLKHQKQICLLENQTEVSLEKKLIDNLLEVNQISLDDYLVGSDDLSTHLEAMLEKKVEQHLSKLKELVKDKLDLVTQRLKTGDLRKFNSYQEWQGILTNISDLFKETQNKYIERQREMLERQTVRIKKSKNNQGVSYKVGSKITDFSDLEPGDTLYCKIGEENETVTINKKEDINGETVLTFEYDEKLLQSNETKVTYTELKDNDGVTNGQTLWYHYTNRYSKENLYRECVVTNYPCIGEKIETTEKESGSKRTHIRCYFYYQNVVPKYPLYYRHQVSDLKKIQDIVNQTRQLKNVVHADVHQVVHAFAKEFSGRYIKICNETTEALKIIQKEWIEILLKPAQEFPMIYQDLKKIIQKVLENIYKTIQWQFWILEQENTQKHLVNTTNPHYLTSKFKDRIEAIGSLATDKAQLQIIEIHVDAYIDDQCKYIQQRVDNIFKLNFVVHLENVFTKYLLCTKKIESEFEKELFEPLSDLCDLQEKLKQPKHLQRERENALKDKEVLRKMALSL